MLHRYCKQFLDYCQLDDFSVRSIQALTIRLNELKVFLKSQRIRLVKKITYRHLINFVADHKDHSIHLRRSLGNFRRNSFLWHLWVIYPVEFEDYSTGVCQI